MYMTTVFLHSFFKNDLFLLIIHRKQCIIKVIRPSLDILEKTVSLMKINNTILMLDTCTILLSSFVMYLFLTYHLECCPFV